jgi:small-conductance mechanosensitive channel
MDYAAWTSALSQSLQLFIDRVAERLPSLVGAAALLLVGWVLAYLLRAWIVRLLGRIEWLVRNHVIQGTLSRLGVERSASEVIGALVFWVIFLLFFTAATETLGLPVLATWLAGVSYYLPRVLVALLIVLAGLLAGNLARDAIVAASSAARIAYSSLLGRAAQMVILLIAVVTAVDQIGIESRFLTATITIVIGAVIGGIGLAFGLGARTAVSNIIAIHYLRQVYQIGQRVRIGNVQGKIIEITATAVLLETADGQVLVPGKEFSETASVLVKTGG